ncbi:MAG: protein kinase [Ardenticatenaceae bacterium]|nr:protein kinase [Ardenticatenaceae bacterium]
MSKLATEKMITGQIKEDRYWLDTLIGEDVLAQIYRANREADGEPFKVKVIRPEFDVDGTFVNKLMTNYRPLFEPLSPYVLPLIDCGTMRAPKGQTRAFYIQPLVAGHSLTNIMENQELPIRDALLVARQMTQGIQAVNDAGGRPHGDLQPDHIWLQQPEGSITMLDYGVAASLDETARQSPNYMSPEQINSEPLSVRSDIYVVGLILHEMISGRRPFEGSLAEVVSQHLQEPPPPLSRPQAGERDLNQIQLIVNRCLQKDPQDRYQTPAELLVVLEMLLSPHTTGQRRPAPKPAVSVTAPAPVEEDQEEAETEGESDVGETPASEPAPQGRLATLRNLRVQAASGDIRQTWLPYLILLAFSLFVCMLGVSLPAPPEDPTPDPQVIALVTSQAENEAQIAALQETVEAVGNRPIPRPRPVETEVPPTETPSPTNTPVPTVAPTATIVPPVTQGVTALLGDSALWVGGSDRLARLSADGESWQVFTSFDGLPSGSLTAITAGQGNDIWVGSSDGLARYDGTNWSVFDPSVDTYPAGVISSLDYDFNRSALWVGTENGLARFDGDVWTTFQVPVLLSNRVTDVLVTSDVWVATSEGINRFDGQRWASFVAEPDGLPTDLVLSLTANDEGLWVGTPLGVSVFNGAAWRTFDATDGVPPGEITRLLTDGLQVWAAGDGGLSRYENGIWEPIPTVNDEPLLDISSVAVIESQLWVGTTAGLLQFDISSGTWNEVEIPRE